MNRNVADQLVVFDAVQSCPYLPGRTARLPLRWPRKRLTPAQLDDCLAAGDRRTGFYLYNTSCPKCRACEPIRLDVARFEPRRTQRRIMRRGDREIRVEVGEPVVDETRVAIFNKHRNLRRLAGTDGDIDIGEYRSFLVDTACETIELTYWVGLRMLGAAICDRGATSLSAVYCFFDPDFSAFSPGTFSVLKQVELCRQWELEYLYLGYYVADSEHMAYKANYRPHQRLVNGKWQWFNS
ncbi:MAG: arginyltransferase [Planctomycetales bacterium]|nr:arginyltransferase [Planctomycetales bacterium]MCA9210064.1 arginyltransferase [Planctomycetales bacterium]